MYLNSSPSMQRPEDSSKMATRMRESVPCEPVRYSRYPPPSLAGAIGSRLPPTLIRVIPVRMRWRTAETSIDHFLFAALEDKQNIILDSRLWVKAPGEGRTVEVVTCLACFLASSPPAILLRTTSPLPAFT